MSKKAEEDFLLLQICKKERIEPNSQNQESLERLKEQGLIQEEGGEFQLTKYGELIRVMGYKSYTRTAEWENEISQYSISKQKRNKWILIMVFLLLLLLCLLSLWIFESAFY